jgi:uncharacterized membrane protein (UPF0127 family)
MKTFLQPLLDSRMSPMLLVNERTGRIVAEHLELAGDSASRRRGLLGRSALAPRTALILAPCPAVHTCFMRFTIDVVFATETGRVIKACHRIRPWRAAFAFGGFAAIELPAGTASFAELRCDDQLVLCPPSI